MPENLMELLRKSALRTSIPIQKIIQKLHPPEPKVNGYAARRINTLIQTGDVLLSREDWHFSNLFIPGFWSHAAIYAGHAAVIESVGGGVRSVELYEWLLKKDYVAVLRPIWLMSGQKEMAAKRAREMVGRPYDFNFSSDISAFYCSELVYWALTQNMKSPFELRNTWGVPTVIPDDFYKAREKFSLVFEGLYGTEKL